MDRRTFVASLAPTGLLAGAPAMAKQGEPFPLEASVADLQKMLAAGRISSVVLAQAYLARIEAIDRKGPQLRSVIEVNPDALALARALDDERRTKGARGPLHGIPVLLKDNIATGDRMSTSAGSLALDGVKAARDAHLVKRLRDAGALVLGKTNLSEWANIRSSHSTSGWSARGGLTKNPYALDRNTSGSSSGSAAATAASLAAVSVGTETDGSIVSPSSIQALVGIKPTVGLVSRDGIVPISHTQDTAGPMTRTVADAAVLLSAIAGPDPRDAATANAKPLDYTQFLDPKRLAGARIGVVRKMFGQNDAVNAVIDRSIGVLKAQGAVVVDPVELKNVEKYGEMLLDLLLFELKANLPKYLSDFAPGAPVRTLADVIEWNRRHAERELALFGQDRLALAEAKAGLDSKEYQDIRETCRRYSRDEGIDAVLAEHKLDALVAPTGGPAWLTDFVNGDHPGDSFSSPAAVAGYPHVTVPAGFVFGLPVGLSFVGTAWSEPTLIGLAYAFEQATHARRPPEFVRKSAKMA
jgi:amidase